jgi:hypothetical protein
MKRYRVIPGSRVDLNRWDPNDTIAFAGDKQEAKKTLRALNDRLEALQELFYAEHTSTN